MSMLSLAPVTRTLGSLASIAIAGSFCLFCENGTEEAVVPLDRAGGMGVTVRIYGDVTEDEVVRKVRAGLERDSRSGIPLRVQTA